MRVGALADNVSRHEVVPGLASQASYLSVFLLPSQSAESARTGTRSTPRPRGPRLVDKAGSQFAGLYLQPGDRAMGSSGCTYDAVRVVHVGGPW